MLSSTTGMVCVLNKACSCFESPGMPDGKVTLIAFFVVSVCSRVIPLGSVMGLIGIVRDMLVVLWKT